MGEKHKRSFSDELTDDEIGSVSDNIKSVLKSLPLKQQRILKEWLDVWCKYIGFEKTFDPKKLRYYKRGEIVLAHFGFNVGSELGGTHYAVVVENNNNLSNNTVTVVPISSMADDKKIENLHHSEVFLGEVIPDSNKKSYAMPLQIRAISKIRIIKPKKSKDGVYKVSSEQLTEIDNKIISLFTKERQEP